MTTHAQQTMPDVIDLGRMPYADAYEIQQQHHARILENRGTPDASVGTILLVEHDPVITVSKRPSAQNNLVASSQLLQQMGVDVQSTDRGGDITYHGPGQIVAYPIIDLNAIGVNLHEYMRRLEEAVIRTCAHWGISGERDPTATGVWVRQLHGSDQRAKIAAMGVRVRRWITMHGLSLNVETNLQHFDLIVPCGLIGRPVTSMQQLLDTRMPSMEDVKAELSHHLVSLLSTGTTP
ncbi:MAG: lipoyl(octanoyl) transferase LipB [Phycisphaeraceae bacterium]|nr:lipoyl(octanoyl) transferase LipB [Phycisphaerales bacterium]MCB9861236.1 lipoyl(octanoyl) transferase LipB [Phycisphaeraceae bacterium]